MTPKTDPVELLASFRPTNEQLEHDWPADQRAVMRVSIRTNATPTGTVTRFRRPATRGHRKQWSAIVGLVGAAAAALLVVQITQSGSGPEDRTAGGTGAATATTTQTFKLAALERLATAAKNVKALEPGEFRHLVVHEAQGQSVRSTLESWTDYDGNIWRHDTDNPVGVEYWSFPAIEPIFNAPTPRYLATLPTDPGALQTYLLTHVCGSSSRDEAMFVGVADMLRGDFASPALRVAAIQVLQRTPHVTAKSSHDSRGRAALQVDFIDQSIRPGEVQSLFFDPNTSSILEEGLTSPGDKFVGTYDGWSTVSAVPADVLSHAVPGGDKPQTEPPAAPAPCTWDKSPAANASDSAAPHK